MNWADLNEKQKQQIEQEYRSGVEPGDIAAKFGLKSKQISDQAYRKKWVKLSAVASEKPAVKKTAKKAAKKAVKKAVKKAAKKAVKKAAKKKTA